MSHEGSTDRSRLSILEGEAFDVAVVGAGVNGCSTAHHLAAAGYRTLLIDKGDFGSGSSSRSSRLLHCGLRYLAPGKSMMDFVLYPGRFLTACSMAKAAMESRQQFVQDNPERVRAFDFYYPITRDLPYKPWQVGLAFRLLGALGPKNVPLGYQPISIARAKKTPLISGLRGLEGMRGLARFTEYQFEWPERIVMDAVLEAQSVGVTARNYTALAGMERLDEGWRLTLLDQSGTGDRATVTSKTVFNMAGIWIDRVNDLADAPAQRRILGTKGSHIVVRLPPDCATTGIATMHRENEPFYCIPWRGLHYFGPTETVYDGDPDDIRPTESEIEWLMGEANHLFPALGLKRKDVLAGWAGVRPLTYDPAQPKGARSRELHNLEAEGMPGVYAMTAGPIMTHRSAGLLALDAVHNKIKPSGEKRELHYPARTLGADESSPILMNDQPQIRLADLETMAREEHVTSLTDLMARRAGLMWSESGALGAAEQAARAVAPQLGWDEARILAEVEAFRAYAQRFYLGPFDRN